MGIFGTTLSLPLCVYSFAMQMKQTGRIDFALPCFLMCGRRLFLSTSFACLVFQQCAVIKMSEYFPLVMASILAVPMGVSPSRCAAAGNAFADLPRRIQKLIQTWPFLQKYGAREKTACVCTFCETDTQIFPITTQHFMLLTAKTSVRRERQSAFFTVTCFSRACG
jgi:hypothetical protein